MSLLDLIKDKPPVVSDSDVPWPPPNKDVGVSSSQTAVLFLTSSPLFPAKRTPSLREFLNPNYRDRREEKKKDSINETSDLLLAIEKNISSNSLSKTDFDLQRKMRHRSSSINYYTEEKVLDKVPKGTEETHTASVDQNLDSERDSGVLGSKKDKNFQKSTLSNLSLTSTEEDVVQQDIAKELDNVDALSRPNVFHNNATNQEISETDSHAMAIKGQENVDSSSVHVDNVSALKRKMSESKSEMINEELTKKAKRRFTVEKQENKLLSDESGHHLSEHTDKVCTPRRNIPPTTQCVEEERILDMPNKAQEIALEDDERNNKQSNDVEGFVDREQIEEKLSVKNVSHSIHSDEEERMLDTANKAQVLSLKADEGNTQSNDVEESVDTGHVEEGLFVKNVSHSIHSDEEERMPDTAIKAQVLSLKADEGNTQSNDVEESVDTGHVEEELIVKNNGHTTHNDEEERTQDTANKAQVLSLKADKGSTQSNDVEESMDTGHVEEGLSVSSDSHTTHISEEDRKLDSTARLSLKADEGSAQSNDVEESVDKEHIDKRLPVKSNSCIAHSFSEEGTTQDTANKAHDLPLKNNEGSTHNKNVQLKSTNEEHDEKEHCNLTTEEAVQEDNDTSQNKKELLLKTDTVRGEQKREDLGVDGKQEDHDLSLLTDTRTCTSPSLKSKSEDHDTVIDTTKKKTIEEGNGKDEREESFPNTKPETEDSTENKTEISNESQKDNFEIPKSPQNVKSHASLQRKIFITDSSELSSTETEASYTDLEGVTNQDHCSKEAVLSNFKIVSKFKDSSEGTSDSAKDSTVNKINLHQEMASKNLETNDMCSQMSIDSSSGSDEDSSSPEKQDEGANKDLEVEESIEVLVFNDDDDDGGGEDDADDDNDDDADADHDDDDYGGDDDDDDDDGLEDGEIDEESFESEESMNGFEPNKDHSNESIEQSSGENMETLEKTKTSSPSKKRKMLSEQDNFPKKIKSLPSKNATIDASTRKPSTEPVLDPSTTPEQESKVERPLEEETKEEFSLLSSLTCTAVMDVTVAASEKELIKKKSRGGKVSAQKRKKLQKRRIAFMARKEEEKKRYEIRMEPRPKPVCIFYLSGSCNKGDCQFRHEGTPTKKPNVCKYYVMRMCDKGDSCPYQHEAYPCRYYHLGSGNCRFGNRCRFSHARPTPETQVLFDQLIAESLGQQNNPTDVKDGYNENALASSTDDNKPSPSVSEPKNLYSVRYGSIDEEDFKESGTGVQEAGIDVKEEPTDCEKKIKAEEQNESSPAITPSYVVPGMYTS